MVFVSGKRGVEALDFWKEWLFVLAMVIGFVISLSMTSPALNYVVVFFCGFLFGRMLYKNKAGAILQYYLLAIGFVLGYSAGFRSGNLVFALAYFVLGLVIDYMLHSKGVIKK